MYLQRIGSNDIAYSVAQEDAVFRCSGSETFCCLSKRPTTADLQK